VDLSALHLPGLEYARNSLLALAFNPQAQSFLILGLGGGSIPQMLLAARPAATVDAVEIDPEIPDLARRFFQLETSARFQVYLEDAAAYVARCAKQYDIVMVDTYVGEVLPAQCTTGEFFSNARRLLGNKGLLVINWMRGDPQRFRGVLSNVEDLIGPVWLLNCYRSQNTLIFAPLREFGRQELLVEAGRLGRELPFASGLARLARRLQKPNPSGKPVAG
jgi:spermidine synthase